MLLLFIVMPVGTLFLEFASDDSKFWIKDFT